MSTQDPNDGFTDEDIDEAKWCSGTPAAAKKRRLAEDAKCRAKEMRQAAKREVYLFKENEQLRAARLQREANGEQPEGAVWKIDEIKKERERERESPRFFFDKR